MIVVQYGVGDLIILDIFISLRKLLYISKLRQIMLKDTISCLLSKFHCTHISYQNLIPVLN